VLRRINHKAPANALTITVVIAIALGLLTASLVLSAYYLRRNVQVMEIESQLQANLESATNYILGDTVLYPDGREATMNIFASEKDSVIVHNKLWGLFGTAFVKAYSGSFSKEKCFFYGSPLPAFMNSCIYLADHRRSLSVVGNTRLTGDAYLSKSGIKASFINQRGYRYANLINGVIRESQENLPLMQSIALQYLTHLLDTTSILSTGSLEPSRLVQSFSQPVLTIKETVPIFLSNKKIKGHILIQSDSAIEVSANNDLENVILAAPLIRFQEGFSGTVQAFATDSLVVSKNCRFSYPSSLVLIKSKSDKKQPLLQIGEGSAVTGLIFSICDNKDTYKTFVDIKPNSRIRGVIYVNGYLSLQSDVEGTVSTDYFIYRSSSTIYENHLVDVEINRNRLPAYFGGTPFFDVGGNRKIIQWVE
jgi:hypothetical protein